MLLARSMGDNKPRALPWADMTYAFGVVIPEAVEPGLLDFFAPHTDFGPDLDLQPNRWHRRKRKGQLPRGQSPSRNPQPPW